MLKRLLLALALISSAPVFAQVPAPVPALPDTERRTSYSLSASTCACNVNFALYGDSTDYGNWIEVFLTTGSGTSTVTTKLTAVTDYTVTSPSGSLATLPRPISDAVVTLTSTRTGTLQIVGSRRPRRTSQFSENRGVAARDLNQALTDIVAQNREVWDRTNDTTGRAILAPPAETLGALPPAAARAGGFLCWDGTGLIPLACGPGNGSGNVIGPNVSVVGHVATYGNVTGSILLDGGLIGTGDFSGPAGAVVDHLQTFASGTGKLGKDSGYTLTTTGKLYPSSDSTTALQFCKADGTTCPVVFDSTNQSLAAATLKFTTLDPTSLTSSPSTITGLTVNNTPSTTNDYLLYYNAASGLIRKATVGAIAAGATAGVGSLNSLTGVLSIGAGAGMSVTPAGSTVTVGLSNAPIANGGTGTTNLIGLTNGLQPLKLSGAVIAVNPGTWANNTGTAVFNSTSVLTADMQSAVPNFTPTPATGAQVSGTLTAVANSTDGTEVFLYLIHRNSDSKVALVGSSADAQGTSLTFTATAAAPGVFTTTAHGLRKRMAIYFSNSGGALPAPLAAPVTATSGQYYVCSVPTTTTFTVATSLANVNAGSCLTLTTTGSGTNTASWGVQKDIDYQLGAGIATMDRRLPYFAFVWDFTRYGPSSGIPNFTVPQGGARTVLTSMDETTKYCTGALTPGASYTAQSFANQLANINRQALFHVVCAGGASGGGCFMRTTSGGGSETVGVPSASATVAGNLEMTTDSTGQVDLSTTGTATINVCLKGWTQMDPS